METTTSYAPYDLMVELGEKTMNSHSDYERWEEENEKRNRCFIEIFRSDMMNAHLSERTIQKHVQNAELFLDEMEFRESAVMEDALPGRVISYMQFDYIRKGAATSESGIQSFAASLKKFAKSMEDHHLIPKGSSNALKKDLTEELDTVISRFRDYYDILENDDDDDFLDFSF